MMDPHRVADEGGRLGARIISPSSRRVDVDEIRGFWGRGGGEEEDTRSPEGDSARNPRASYGWLTVTYKCSQLEQGDQLVRKAS